MLDVRRLEADLRRALARFVAEVTSAVDEALAEAQAPTGARSRRPKKRFRRRAVSLDRLGDAALGVLARRSHVAVSEIAADVGVTPREMLRPLTILLARGKITKSGERRGTRYSLAPRPGPPSVAKPPRTKAAAMPKKVAKRGKGAKGQRRRG